MYLYVTHVLLVCTRMYSYVTRMLLVVPVCSFSHDPLYLFSQILVFTSLVSRNRKEVKDLEFRLTLVVGYLYFSVI